MSEIKTSRGGARPGTGGKRPGAGRPKGTGIVWPTEEVIIKELVIPCVATAMKSALNTNGSGVLNLYLSKVDIGEAYGPKGISVFLKYFTQTKLGFKRGSKGGLPTLWSIHTHQYFFVKTLIQEHGLKMNALPLDQHPPKAMVERLVAAHERRLVRMQKKVEREQAALEAA